MARGGWRQTADVARKTADNVWPVPANTMLTSAQFDAYGPGTSTRQAERRAHLDLQVNLLAEPESTATLRIVQGVARHLGIAETRLDDVSLSDETDLEQLASRIDQACRRPPSGRSEPPR
jgi:hypothetical protein